MTNKEIGNRIKYARELREITLDDIAREVGVAKSTVQRYENGKIQTIKLPVVESIAYALNVNPAWIIGKSDEIEIMSNMPLIMQYFQKLNDIGKEEAEKRVYELTQLEMYIEIQDSEKIRQRNSKRFLSYYERIHQKTPFSMVAEDSFPYGAIAAHNEHADEPGEEEKMLDDICNLKKPQ